MNTNYKLLDSGEGEKLEQFGPYRLIRPCSQAVWKKNDPSLWNTFDARFTREEGNKWEGKRNLQEDWEILISSIRLKLSPTDFGHLGVFPEHSTMWPWLESRLQIKNEKPDEVLNLFAYSGASTCFCAKQGARVCHVDSSKGMIQWASENAALNKLENANIRWIVDDAMKFVKREQRRGRKYQGILLDPPSFGRGAKGEIFKIEHELLDLLEVCADLLAEDAKFFLFTCHTPGFTPLVMQYLLEDLFKKRGGVIEAGELALPGGKPCPSGSFGTWRS